MFLPIVVYGHPILRKISEDITPEYPELDKFIRDLFQTTQERLDIGHTFRVAVIHLFGVTDNKKIYFFMG